MIPAAPPPDVQPVTLDCLVAVSRRYQVPLEVLAGILAQEHGRLGAKSPNRDGSADLGPMQINTFWLPTLRRYGIAETHLLYHGCYNVAVGAWIVRYEQARGGGELWRAVGRYHSPQPERAAGYVRRVAGKVRDLLSGRLTLARLLRYANGGEG
jgi:soluble lytic murein transglycosylase-like protein